MSKQIVNCVLINRRKKGLALRWIRGITETMKYGLSYFRRMTGEIIGCGGRNAKCGKLKDRPSEMKTK